MTNHINHIFTQSNCPSSEALKKYASGALDKETHRAVEHHLIDCPMCADEVEGLSMFENPTEFEHLIYDIHTEIDNKTSKKTVFFTPFILKIAASFILVSMLSWIIIHQYHTKDDTKLLIVEKNQEEKPASVLSYVDTSYFEQKEIQKPSIPPPTEVPKVHNTISGAAGSTVSRQAEELNQPILDSDYEISPASVFVNDNKPALSDFQTTSLKEDRHTVTTIAEEKSTMKASSDKNVMPTAAYRTESLNYERGAKKKGKKKQLDSSLHKPEQNMPITTGYLDSALEITEEENILQFPDALNAYNNKQFTQAINILEVTPPSDSVFYFLGMSYFNLHIFEKAIINLQKVQNNKTLPFYAHAQWYYAQSLLKTNNIIKAKNVLQIIIDEEGIYASIAKTTLKGID